MFSDRNLLLLALVVTAITLGLSNGSWAADVSWDGGGDGATWNDNQNWAGDNGPGDGDDRGILGDTAVDRTVVINWPGPDESLGWEQTTGGAVNKIQLNTDWNPSMCCIADLNYVNTTGDPGALVLDLNGNKKHQLQGASHVFPPMTIMSSQPGGELVYARKLEWAANEVVVGENVTIRSKFGGYNNTFGPAGSELAWHPNSKLIVDGNDGVFTGTTKFGDVDVVNNADWGNNGFFTIQGDLNIEAGSNINLLQGTPQRMALMGNITDLNTTSDYTDGRLEFVGSGNVQEINIRRPLKSSINVKEQASVRLMHDLDASANIAQNPHESTWTSAGTIDLNGFDFLTNQLVVADNTNIIYGAGTDSSVIEVTDRLGNIGPFNVTIVDQGGWNSGDDFVLFDYAGKKGVYGPTLGSVMLPSGWQHGGLIDTGDPNDPDAPGTLVLSNLQTSGGSTGSGNSFTWNRAGGGSWGTSTNWSPSGVPDSQDHDVSFAAGIPGGTVTVDSSVAINKITLDNSSASFTVAGPGTLSLQASTALVDPSISVASGSHTISADIHQVDGVTIGVAGGARLTVGAVNLDGGTLQKEGTGELRIDGTAAGSTGNLVANAGTISGSGTVGGDFINVSGNVAPGSSAGILTVGGIYNQGEDATLSIELGGTTAGDEYDRLVVNGGMAVLDGILDVSLIDGFALSGSMQFDILDASQINGDFSTLNLPAGLTWDASDGTLSFGSGGGLPGDFNGDGTVDAADYVVWSDNRGAGDESALGGNGDGIGGVGQSDYLLWKNSFGNTSGSGSSAAIPEPAALSLLLVTALSVLVGYRRR